MKKLLSLTLVLMLLFTTISFTSVSAATMEVSLVKADLSAATTINDYTVSGPDAGKIANPSLNQKSSGTYTSDDGKTYKNARSLSLTTPSAAGIGTALGIASDEKIIKISQDANTSILRFFMGDGSLSAKTGDVIKYKIKVYYTDFVSESGYTKDGVAVPATKMETVPETWNDLKWGYLKDNKASSGRTGLGLRSVATNQWVQLEYTYEITSATDADLTSYGFAAENYSFNALAGYKNFPSTIYLAQPEIVNVTEVATNKITAVKLGEGTVTGDGDIMTGETANLTATAADGYTFAGWYEKGADQSNAALLCADATYSFTVSSDKEVVAVFEKDAVDSWVELTRLTFTGDIPANINLWSKDSAWSNVNGVQVASTYADEEMTAPDTSFGADMLKIDSARQAKSAYGMVDGRIGYIPGYKVRFEEGQKYRISVWMYVAETAKGKEAGEEMFMAWGPYKGNTTALHDDKVKIGEWVKLSHEFTADSSWANVYTGLRLSPANVSAADKEANYDNVDFRDSIKLGYIDEIVFERFDGVEVTAEATNGTVYGTGTYAKGDSVTLNAGADAGYKFAGYYTNDDTLLSAEPKYTFTVNADTNVVAKFVEADKYVRPSDVIYLYGNEEGDVGIYNTWFYNDKNGDGKVTAKDNPNTDVVEPNEQNSSEPYNMPITYQELAEEGIYKPNDDAIFGDKLYQQKRLEGDIGNQMSGRFRGWENGSNGVTTKYVSGKQYKFTWWVNPVSMQIANGEETQPATTTLTVSMQYDAKNLSGLSHTFTLNVGEWNKLEWVFTANDKMASIAPGLRYDWGIKTNTETTFSTVTNWALYDAITVEEITEWQFSDTKFANGGWFRYRDYGDYTGTANSNTSAGKLAPYTDYPDLPKASDDAGNNVVVFDFSEPSSATAANFKPKAGSAYEGKTFEEAYAYLTRVDNAGNQNGGRFNNITTAGTLKIGSTYKLSYKIYVPEVLSMLTGEKVDNPNISARIIGTHTGNNAVGDGKDVYKKLETGKWVEVGYTFKATEKGAEYAPSLKFELAGVGAKDGDELTENSIMIPLYFIDDVTVELVHVDDLALEISEDDTTVTATATVNDIKSGSTLKAIVIIAAYDADGKLINVALSSENGEDVAIDGTITATYTKNAEENVKDYVAFLWDDLTNIRPYVLPVTLDE